jgi:NitT/TauT family transport system permease protein
MIRDLFTPNGPRASALESWAVPYFLLAIAWVAMPTGLIPSPLAVLESIPRLWLEEGFGQELWTSIALNLEAATLMIVVSLLVSYGTRIPALAQFATVFSFGRFNSFVGLPFLLTIVIGNPHWIKVTLLAMAMSVFSVPAIVDIIGTIPPEAYDDARVLRMGEWQVLCEVVILGKRDEVIDVLRTQLAMGWMMLPMVEGLFRSEGGIGVMLLTQNKYLRLDYVYAIILLVGLLGLGMDRMVLLAKQLLCPYIFVERAKA